MFREAEVFTLSGLSVHFDRNTQNNENGILMENCQPETIASSIVKTINNKAESVSVMEANYKISKMQYNSQRFVNDLEQIVIDSIN